MASSSFHGNLCCLIWHPQQIKNSDWTRECIKKKHFPHNLAVCRACEITLRHRRELTPPRSVRRGVLLVGDKKQSTNSIHVNVEDLSLDDRIVAFWSETPTYDEYLLTHFDQAWAQGVEAQERLNELREQRP